MATGYEALRRAVYSSHPMSKAIDSGTSEAEGTSEGGPPPRQATASRSAPPAGWQDKYIILPGETPWWQEEDPRVRSRSYKRQYLRGWLHKGPLRSGACVPADIKHRRQREKRNEYQRGKGKTLVGTQVNGKYIFLAAPHKRPKPAKCELCGKVTKRLGYHHWDDGHPSHGMHLCYACHMLIERWENGGGDIIAKYLILKDIIDDEMSGLE